MENTSLHIELEECKGNRRRYATCFLSICGTFLIRSLLMTAIFQGYTIPLDKRLAADGRGLQQVHINENFATLAESLYIADRKVSKQ